MTSITEDCKKDSSLLEFTAQIVASHVSNNTVDTAELTALMDTVYSKLCDLSAREGHASAALQPAVPIAQSVTDDHIVCLEDGRRFKMLKKHLRARYNMTPEEYRAKWNLPPDYPMVAPSYAAKRRRLARESGLGRNTK